MQEWRKKSGWVGVGVLVEDRIRERVEGEATSHYKTTKVNVRSVQYMTKTVTVRDK